MLCFTELLMEQKVYLCLLCWGTATTSFTIPIRGKAVTAQGSADREVLALEIPNLRLLLCSLHFLFWRGSSGSTEQGSSSGPCSEPPTRWVSFSASRAWSALLVLTTGGFSLHCSRGGLPAQNRFTHLHDCHCPLSLILGSHNVFTVLLIFPGPGGLPECITSPALCGISARSSLSQSPFFPPFLCFCHSSALCSASQTTSLEWHRLLPISRLGRICSRSSCPQELFSRHSRGIDTTILWSSCVISAQKSSSSSSMCKVEDNCSSLGSGQPWPTQAAALGAVCSPGILSSYDQARSCYLTQPYLTKVEWVTDETWLLNVSSLGQGLS